MIRTITNLTVAVALALLLVSSGGFASAPVAANSNATPAIGMPLGTSTPLAEVDAAALRAVLDSGRSNVVPGRDDAIDADCNFLLMRDPDGNWWGSVVGIFDAAGVDYDVMTDPADLATTDLSGYDVIWIADYASDGWNSTYNSNRSYVDDWVDAGGVLYHCTGTNNFGTYPIHPGGLTMFAAYYWYGYVATDAGECSMFDALGWGLNTALYGTYFSHTAYTETDIDAAGGDYQLLVTSGTSGSGYPITARYEYGAGQVVVSGTTDGAAYNWYGFTWGDTRHEIFHYLCSIASHPEIAVDPSSLDLGTLEFRRCADMDFEVCNVGNATLSVSDMVVSGDDFSVNFSGAFDLEPEECATFTVTYCADNLGSASGTVTISSNGGEAIVDLSGESVWVEPAVLLGRLCAKVDAFKAAGVLNRGQANSLCVKLNNAIRALGRGQPHVALNVLNAFRNEVAAFVAGGILTAAQGACLTDEANFIAALITDFELDEFGTTLKLSDNMVPESVQLYSAFPNPFNSSTTIRYAVPEAGAINVSVFDVSGRLVATLVNGQVGEGFHNLSLTGVGLNSGMYLVRLTGLGADQSTKIFYVR